MEEKSYTGHGGRGERKGRRRGEVEEGKGGQEAYRRWSEGSQLGGSGDVVDSLCLRSMCLRLPLFPARFSSGVVDFAPSPARFPLSPARFAIPVTGRRQFLLSPPIPSQNSRQFHWASARTSRDDAQASGATPFFPGRAPNSNFLGVAPSRPLQCAPTTRRRLGDEFWTK
jgi:hypothetical protein